MLRTALSLIISMNVHVNVPTVLVLMVMLEFTCFILKTLNNGSNFAAKSSQPGLPLYSVFPCCLLYIRQQDPACQCLSPSDSDLDILV